jgi:SAM-dependent methyltransferase
MSLTSVDEGLTSADTVVDLGSSPQSPARCGITLAIKVSALHDQHQPDGTPQTTCVPLADNCAAFVLFSHVIEHLYQPISCLHEAARVLRPGGRILVPQTMRSDGIISSLRNEAMALAEKIWIPRVSACNPAGKWPSLQGQLPVFGRTECAL